MEHNKPSGFDPNAVFDQATVPLGDETPRGGVGKAFLYITGLAVKFKSEPLTSLIRALLKLFRSLNEYNTSKNWEKEPFPSVVKDVEKLKDCVEIKRLYAGALESEGWPTVCDKVQD